MRTYTILPKTGEWKDIPAAPIDTRLWTPEVNISATAQVCYDADALYLRLAAKEKDIRAEENGPLGMPCQDSCLEFFFSPPCLLIDAPSAADASMGSCLNRRFCQHFCCLFPAAPVQRRASGVRLGVELLAVQLRTFPGDA